jgi:hypothetical protein
MVKELCHWSVVWLVTLSSLASAQFAPPQAAVIRMDQSATIAAETADAQAPHIVLSLDRDRFQAGDLMTLMLTVVPGDYPWPVDLYIALQLPNQAILFLQGDRSLTPESRPFVAGWTMTPVSAGILQHTFTGGEAWGSYVWLAVLAAAGTPTTFGNLAQAPFVVEGLTFSDNFDDGVAGGWSVVEGSWNIVNGEAVEMSDAGSHNIAVHGPNVLEFLMTAQLRTTDDDDIGLVFWYQDPGNFYVVTLNDQNDRIQVRRRLDGAFQTLANVTANSYIKGVPIELGIRAQQTRLQVYLNGRTVIDTTVVGAPGGVVGLYARSNKFAAFDNVRVMPVSSLKPIGGNIIYVDAHNVGGPQNGLTEATAWSTINQALQDPRFQSSAGNTVIVLAGIYREQVDVFARMSGIPGAFNTIRAAPGAQVVVDGEKDTPNARVEAALIHTGVSYVRLEGLTLSNAQHRCLLVFESGPAEIVFNRIEGCGDAGLEFWYGAHYYTVAYNLIFANQGDGLIIAQGSGDDTSRFKANQGIIVRNNLIVSQGVDGIAIDGNKPHTFALHNNTIVGNRGNGVFIDHGAAGGDLRNNIIVANGAIGLKNFADMHTDYNNIFGNGVAGDANYADGPDHMDPGDHTISVDPLFVNAAAGDFRLQAGSLCINAGDPDARFNDVDGTRNDLGLFGGPP